MTRLHLLVTAVAAIILLSGSARPEKALHPRSVTNRIAVTPVIHAAPPSSVKSHAALVRPGNLVALSGTSRTGFYRRGGGLPVIGGQRRTEFAMAINGTNMSRKH